MNSNAAQPLGALMDVVAALYVQKDGAYIDLPGVDPWDERRDARLYDGPYPVVAHPPCARWCQLAPVNEARYGTPVGHDGGCFAAALEAVETFGGVLEHPAYTLAWHAFDLPRPRRGSWQRGGLRRARRGWRSSDECRHDSPRVLVTSARHAPNEESLMPVRHMEDPDFEIEECDAGLLVRFRVEGSKLGSVEVELPYASVDQLVESLEQALVFAREADASE